MAEEFPDYVKDKIKSFLNDVVPKIPNLSIRIIDDDMTYVVTENNTSYTIKFKIELGENVYGNINVTYWKYINGSDDWYSYKLHFWLII